MLNFIVDLPGKILSRRPLAYLLLFLVVGAYFLWLNSTPNFADPDSFYHAKIAELIKNSGPVKDFYWLPFTTLDDIYIDHHFLYHLILIPFLFVFNPLLAIKISAVIFAALAILAFQWLLDKFKIKYSLVYTILLLLVHQFIFRINLAKIPSLSLIFLLCFIYLLFTNKNKWSWLIFGLSFAYVWLYGGWPIMLGIGFVYFLTSLKAKPFLSALAGIICGLVINPYFPTNLKFYWQQTFQIGLINYQNVIDVGGEWYGMSFFSLVQYDLFIIILFILALLIFFIYFKKSAFAKAAADRQNFFNSTTLLIISIIFFILTLKSQRNIEYFIPFVLLFSSFTINNFLEFKKINLTNQIVKLYFKHQKIALLFIILLALYSPIIIGANFNGLKEDLRKNYNFNQFTGMAAWLKENSDEGDIVFHDRWDDWPVFFYHNSYNRYIIGLDSTFMYLKNEHQYWSWKNITTGMTSENICAIIKDEFAVHYVFVKTGNEKLKNNLDQDNLCQLVYEDKDGFIYNIN